MVSSRILLPVSMLAIVVFGEEEDGIESVGGRTPASFFFVGVEW
jgi:hypothetical protein